MTENKRSVPTIYQDIKACSLVIEVRDIRLPESSAIRFLHSKFQTKNKIIFLTKKDLVSTDYAEAVLRKIRGSNLRSYAVCASEPQVLLKILRKELALNEQAQASLLKISRSLMIGLPNVGKSSLINAIKGRQVARVANVPGVTKGRQWIKVNPNCYLMDSPGVASLTHATNRGLKMKFAACRMISEKEFDFGELSTFFWEKIILHPVLLKKLCRQLFVSSPENFDDHMNIDDHMNFDNQMNITDILSIIGQRFGCLMKGGAIDYERAAYRFCMAVEEKILPELDLDGFLL